MDKQKIIQQTANMVKQKLLGESSGHDRRHVYRVRNNAKKIAQNEQADIFIVELAALLHDIADYKFNNLSHDTATQIISDWLEQIGLDNETSEKVLYITDTMSFRGKDTTHKMEIIEGQIVQDADRLDAIGAIGTARNFMTGAKFNEVMHDPNIAMVEYETPEQYTKAKKQSGRTVINHFYEKSLHLIDMMNTTTGKKIAQHRHQYMEGFLQEFLAERNGIK